jgi:proteasome accessory factor C
MRFTPAELAAILIGLAWDGDELPAFARELARVGAAEADSPRQHHVAPAAGPGEAAVVRLAHQAIEERRVLTIKYAGAADRLGTDRAIEPHDVVAAQGRFYIVAWCRKKGAWRTFRADRVLDALLEEMRFSPRDDFRPPCAPEDVFRTADEPDGVRVRFSRAIARWLRERHPDAEPAGDGSAVVTYRVADPAWLVGTVLQYGAEAEVVEPAEWRAVMGRALGVRG